MIRFLLILLGISSCAAHAQETLMRIVHDTKTDTHVEVLALFTDPVPGGYLPVRITLANNQNRRHQVELTSQSSSQHGNKGSQCEANFVIAADPGRVVTRDILVPVLPAVTSSLNSTNTSLKLTGSMGTDEHYFYQNFEARQPRVLISTRLHTENAAALDREAAAVFGSTHRHGKIVLTSRFDPKQLPGEWLAYAAYDWMVVTDEEWSEIPAGQRNAILAWVRLGGNLDVRHRMERFERSRLGLPEDPGFGSISGSPIEADMKLNASGFVRGLGTSLALPPRGRSLSEDFDGGWPLQQGFGIKGYQFGLFIAVLTVFALLVGPVNLFLFAPAGRRHRLFLTTPLISLGASLLMVGIILFQDGMGGSGMRVVLMEVRPDEGQNAAFIHQEQISRTGILLRGSFSMAMPVQAHPVPIAPSRWARLTNRGDSGGAFHLQPGAGGIRASGDWFQSRSEQGHFISAVSPSRGRIESDGRGGYVSTFPHTLDGIFIRNADASWDFAENVSPGVPFRAKPIHADQVETRFHEDARSRFSSRLGQMFDRAKARENHFVAISDDAPGIETHPSIHWRQTRTVITGPVVP